MFVPSEKGWSLELSFKKVVETEICLLHHLKTVSIRRDLTGEVWIKWWKAGWELFINQPVYSVQNDKPSVS